MKKYLFFIMAGCILAACSNSGSKPSSPRKDHIDITNDMENAKGIIPSWVGEKQVIKMTDPIAHSGSYSCITSDTNGYSYKYEEMFKNINDEVPKRVIYSGWIYTTVANPQIAIICSIDENGQNYNWKPFPLQDKLTEVGKWVEFSTDFYLDDKPIKPEMFISLYAWNQSKKTVFLDDVKITFLY
jgi:hypothetical protein